MLIDTPQDLTVTDNFTLGRFGEVSLSVNGRLRNPTNIVAPGAPAIAQQDLNDRSRILLDDGNGQQNIDPTVYPAGGLSASNTLRSGYTVHHLTGVLEQRFSVYRVQPVGPISFDASTNPRAAGPAPVGGTLKVAALNVLNFFTSLDTGSPICGPSGGLDCRGANSAFEFNRQRDKIINAILAIDPDVAGLMEVQNDASATIQNLVDGLNDQAGAGTYAFINTGTIGTDAIKVALIYKPARVTPVGAFAILSSAVDPQFIDAKNRPSLAQTFQQASNGEKITIVVNHLKSKGSDCNDVGDPDTGDGQGNCNLTRTKAAQALVNWLATDPTGSGDPDFLIVGDMNSYAREDPITMIRNAGYTNLIASFIGADAYSFVFDGQSGYLDHALASSSLTSQVTGVAEWHNNADEPTVLDYNVEFKTANQVSTFYSPAPYRASDHDPVIVGLNLNTPPVAQDQSVSTREDTPAAITLGATDANNNPLTYTIVDQPAHGTLSGTGPNRTYTPAANYNGPDSFTFKANDGTADSNVATVSINVTPVNDAPTIAVVAGGQCLADFRGLANLAIGDVETPAGSLTLSGSSSNTVLVPNANITFGGSGVSHTVTIATAAGRSGSATVTIGVHDGADTTTITIQVIAGTSNNDSLNGTSGPDMLFAGNAQDTLNGREGNDLLCAGQGDDQLTGGGDADTLDGGQGQDRLDGGEGSDTLLGGQGDDRLTGGSGADLFDGGQGNDTATDFNAGEGDTKINIP
jgi:Ca2+-binding RTX toxin-like protein